MIAALWAFSNRATAECGGPWYRMEVRCRDRSPNLVEKLKRHIWFKPRAKGSGRYKRSSVVQNQLLPRLPCPSSGLIST